MESVESPQVKKIYCLKCRDRTENKTEPTISYINGRPSLNSKCGTCDSSKFVFTKKPATEPAKEPVEAPKEQ